MLSSKVVNEVVNLLNNYYYNCDDICYDIIYEVLCEILSDSDIVKLSEVYNVNNNYELNVDLFKVDLDKLLSDKSNIDVNKIKLLLSDKKYFSEM
jgi:hypothetical protein